MADDFFVAVLANIEVFLTEDLWCHLRSRLSESSVSEVDDCYL